MSSPTRSRNRKARKHALDICFEAELRGRKLLDTLADHEQNPDVVVRELTTTLVHGVAEHQSDIDARIQASSTGWSLNRMPRVDRNLARLGIFELDYTDTPQDVIISEMVDLAAELSTAESPTFLNGLLAAALSSRKRSEN